MTNAIKYRGREFEEDVDWEAIIDGMNTNCPCCGSEPGAASWCLARGQYNCPGDCPVVTYQYED